MLKIGSDYFFNGLEGFEPNDIDYIELVDNPTNFKYVCHIRGMGKCIFYWKRMSVDEFIEYTINNCSPMSAGKFLVKEFCDEIGFKIDDLKKLESVFNKLDDKHKYEKKIYDYYIKNNDFKLTKRQLTYVYKEYKKYR